MTQYLVIKSVQLLVGRKTYRKDMIMTAEDVGEDKIKRYLAGGYIKPIGGVADDAGTVQDDEEQDGISLLTPEEVDKLRKPELLAYAEEIGMENINPKDTAPQLKDAINAFIEDMMEAEAEDNDDEDNGENNDDEQDGDNDPSNADPSGDGEQQSLNNGGET